MAKNGGKVKIDVKSDLKLIKTPSIKAEWYMYECNGRHETGGHTGFLVLTSGVVTYECPFCKKALHPIKTLTGNQVEFIRGGFR